MRTIPNIGDLIYSGIEFALFSDAREGCGPLLPAADDPETERHTDGNTGSRHIVELGFVADDNNDGCK